mmetsp:Transcript_103841/g.292225  ORF Transcript_103841/g.292225 Transcript_103841/m.292225 type:complete len:326 (+) Transcript_103841:73-1050(+)
MPPKKLDPKDFRFLERKGEQLAKRSGDVNGIDFLIDGCEDCHIIILDHVAQIFIDYCKRCTIVIGAVASSAFIRNCENCRIKVICGQLRTRDCVDCDLLVQVPGQPIIESSKGMRFGPVLTAYPDCEKHLEEAGLRKRFESDSGRCQWTKIYDFSPSNPPGGNHWSALSRAEAREVAVVLAQPDEVPLLLPRDPFLEGEEEEAGGEVKAKCMEDAAGSSASSVSIEEASSCSLADGGFGGKVREVRAGLRGGSAGVVAAVRKALVEEDASDGVVWLVALGSAIPNAAAATVELETGGGVRISCVQTGLLQGSRPQLRVACRRSAP